MVLSYHRDTGKRFGAEEIELLTRFGQLVSIALDNARLYTAAQEARETAETANKSKSIFLTNMSHELRTPLNAIIGYTEMLMEEAQELGEATFVTDLEKIREAGKHLLTLINDVLDLSKVEAGKTELYLEEFSVAQVVAEVVNTLRPLVAKNGNTLDITCPDEVGLMYADLTKVRQVLFNLLSNAAKFTKQGLLQLTVTRTTPVTPGDPANLIFEMTDSGIGIPPEQMDKLFQAFTQADPSTTRQYGGTGLGLAITKHFCQMMGGDVTVKSEVGVGSTFTMHLPAEVIDPTTKPVSPPAVPPLGEPAPRQTILVIDDDSRSRELLERYFSKAGFQVATAVDGASGLRLAHQLRPNAITLDVLMPGQDGWAILTTLKADPALADIPVIILTMLEDTDLGYTLGAVECLTKPVERERLVQLVQKYLKPDAAEVLVVEDNPETREMLRRMLQKEGWQVAEASNGQQALAHLAASEPALILLDLMMPEMDGFEFITALRRHEPWQTLPVIVVTAKDLTRKERLRLNEAVVKVLQKGAYTREELLAQVCRLLAPEQEEMG
jgi:signal transduction histidine kinase/DNA-binding response OmpR family regulator